MAAVLKMAGTRLWKADNGFKAWETLCDLPPGPNNYLGVAVVEVGEGDGQVGAIPGSGDH